MVKKEYFFQQKERNFAQKFFEKGLNASSYILLALQEGGKSFLREMPSSYAQFGLLKELAGVNPYKKASFKKETIRTNLYRLVKQGLIEKDPKQKAYCLTDDGKKFVANIENRYLILKKPWDGKLRLVIFDIPEKKKYWRESIRQELVLMQFQQLQKSVYIGKYPVPESLCKEIEDAGMGQFIFIFTIDKADRKKEILKLLETEE